MLLCGFMSSSKITICKHSFKKDAVKEKKQADGFLTFMC